MKKLYITFLAVVLAMAMILPVGVVNAGSGQIEVNGSAAFSFAGIEDKVVGKPGVMKGTIYFDVVYTGDIAGTADEVLKFNMNPNTGEFPNYKTTGEGTQVFTTGTVLGQAGTFTANARRQMRLDGSGKIELTIISGTGDLSGLHGTLVFMIYPQGGGWTGTYSGKLHFAP